MLVRSVPQTASDIFTSYAEASENGWRVRGPIRHDTDDDYDARDDEEDDDDDRDNERSLGAGIAARKRQSTANFDR